MADAPRGGVAGAAGPLLVVAAWGRPAAGPGAGGERCATLAPYGGSGLWAPWGWMGSPRLTPTPCSSGPLENPMRIALQCGGGSGLCTPPGIAGEHTCLAPILASVPWRPPWVLAVEGGGLWSPPEWMGSPHVTPIPDRVQSSPPAVWGSCDPYAFWGGVWALGAPAVAGEPTSLTLIPTLLPWRPQRDPCPCCGRRSLGTPAVDGEPQPGPSLL